MKNIALLGSTGSIGTQTLEIVRANPSEFKVVALSANTNVELMLKQIEEFKPSLVAMYDEEAALKIKSLVNNVEVLSGMEGLVAVSTISSADIVLTAFVGMIGIEPTIAAIKAGKDIALANKETLVTAGHIIIPLVNEMGVKLLPVDSEHSAIFQSLQGLNYDGKNVSAGHKSIKSIVLTASGGPFRGLTLEEMKNKTRFDALKHPNWSMGAKITIDSSTLVNKGLEMMEACWLFGVKSDQINIVIHPESILHSAVEFIDGAVVGQMGCPDMKLPILYALKYPERIYLDTPRLNFHELSKMTFMKPDMINFPSLKMAFDAFNEGGSMPTVYNAANEYLVAKFLKDEIGFLDIPKYIDFAMSKHQTIANPSVSEILDVQKSVNTLLKNSL